MRPSASKSVPKQAYRRNSEYLKQGVYGSLLNDKNPTINGNQIGRSLSMDRRNKNWRPIRVVANPRTLVKGETIDEATNNNNTIQARGKPYLLGKVYGQSFGTQYGQISSQHQPQPQPPAQQYQEFAFKQPNPPMAPKPPKQSNVNGGNRRVYQRGGFSYRRSNGNNENQRLFKPVPPSIPKPSDNYNYNNNNNNGGLTSPITLNTSNLVCIKSSPSSPFSSNTKKDIPSYLLNDFGYNIREKIKMSYETNSDKKNIHNNVPSGNLHSNDQSNTDNNNTIYNESNNQNSYKSDTESCTSNNPENITHEDEKNINKTKTSVISNEKSNEPAQQEHNNEHINKPNYINIDAIGISTENTKSNYSIGGGRMQIMDNSRQSSSQTQFRTNQPNETKTRAFSSVPTYNKKKKQQLPTDCVPKFPNDTQSSPLLFGGKLIPSGQDIISLYNYLCQSNPNIYKECRQNDIYNPNNSEKQNDLPLLYLSSLELQELKTVNRVYYIDQNWEIILNANINAKIFGSNSNTPLGDYSGSSRGSSGSVNGSSRNNYQRIDMNNIFKFVQVSSTASSKTQTSRALSAFKYDNDTVTDKNGIKISKRSSLEYMMNFHPSFHTNSHGEYTNTMIGTHLAFRYKILEIMGKGSFGMCLKVDDYGEKFKTKMRNPTATSNSFSISINQNYHDSNDTSTMKCLKILRSKSKVTSQGKTEVSLLQYVLQKDSGDTSNIVRMERSFMIRGHLAIVFELLSMNLYELICRYSRSSYASTSGRCMPLSLIRKLSVQILNALLFLHSHHIIHADIKPENILLKNPTKSGIKVIDLGSSCFIEERIYSYIQSRFYRAPEVMMGYPYGYGIDIWSMGCVLAELYTGRPLFPGENEADQMRMFVEVLGRPSDRYIQMAPRGKEFYERGELRSVCFGRHRKVLRSRPLECILGCEDRTFVDFIRKCLAWDMNERLTAETALDHPWMAYTIKMLRDMTADREAEKEKRGHKLPNINTKE